MFFRSLKLPVLITDETKENVIKDYIEGYKWAEIAQKYQIAESSVHLIVKGIQRPKTINRNGGRKPKVFSPGEKKRIISAYKSGLSIKYLSKLNHVLPNVIKNIINEEV